MLRIFEDNNEICNELEDPMVKMKLQSNDLETTASSGKINYLTNKINFFQIYFTTQVVEDHLL
jgi:hypothetical protein